MFALLSILTQHKAKRVVVLSRSQGVDTGLEGFYEIE